VIFSAEKSCRLYNGQIFHRLEKTAPVKGDFPKIEVFSIPDQSDLINRFGSGFFFDVMDPFFKGGDNKTVSAIRASR